MEQSIHDMRMRRSKNILIMKVVAAAATTDTKGRARGVQAMPNGHHPRKPIMQQDRAQTRHATAYTLRSTCAASSASQRRLLASLTVQMARWRDAGRCQSPGRDCALLLLRVETIDNPPGASELQRRQLHSRTSPVSSLCAPP